MDEDTNYKFTPIHVNGKLMDLSTPKIMGILNVTADSFFENSRLITETALLKKAEKHISEGAEMLDLGAFSTRPNGQSVSLEEEMKRIEWSTKLLSQHFPNIAISVDTFRGKVAQVAIDNGASIINDISAFSFDPELLDVLAKNKITYILMHIEGTFENMHEVREYPQGITRYQLNFFRKKIVQLQEKGIQDIILDPGFGFSKSMEDNHRLMQELEQFKILQHPLLVGISRKSMIYKKLGITANEALEGTIALNAIALSKGASILRVHDVKEAKDLIQLLF